MHKNVARNCFKIAVLVFNWPQCCKLYKLKTGVLAVVYFLHIELLCGPQNSQICKLADNKYDTSSSITNYFWAAYANSLW